MTENKEVYKKLPLAYRGRYDIFTVMVYYGRLFIPKMISDLLFCVETELAWKK
ncbi:hypothetical protein [Blautia wexlerae]|nr:hypothetical protein [Blautia wexlerae]